MKINPILEKELKIKSRTWKNSTLIFLYIGLISLAPIIFLLASWYDSNHSTANIEPFGMVQIFNIIAIAQLGLIFFILPPMSCGAISSEKSHQTFDLLLCAKIKYSSIILGKIQEVFFRFFILLIASFPILSISYAFGAFSIADLGLLLIFFTSTALLIISLSVFLSSVFKKTIVAIISTYLLIAIVSIIPLILLLTIQIFTRLGFANDFVKSMDPTDSFFNFVILFFSNPVVTLLSILDSISGFFDHNYVNLTTNTKLEHWMFYVAFNSVITYLLVLLSSYIINPIKGYGRN
jgi:ABC-2 type transport system permease protein